jgi:tenascin
LYNCNKNGDCDDGKCRCNDYFYGEYCEKRRCKNDCNNSLDQGLCDEKTFKCLCSLGYSGEDCSENICPNNCYNFDVPESISSGKSRLSLEKRSLEEMFLQVNDKKLAKKIVKLNNASKKARVSSLLSLSSSKFNLSNDNNNNSKGYSNHGVCSEKGCSCNEGFAGTDCALRICPKDCSGNGDCDFNTGKCSCYSGFKGDDCSEQYCVNDCSSNGECKEDKCICKEGFEGAYCEKSKSL